MPLKLNSKYVGKFVNDDEMTGIKSQVESAAKVLHDKTGLGNDFLGWLDLPVDYDKEEFTRIKAAAERIQSNSDVLIVIGNGGTYLGARAAIEFLKSPFYNNMKNPADPTPISYGLNSRLVKRNGKIQEQVYKVGGRYSEALEKVVYWLEKLLPLQKTTSKKQ